MLSIVARAAPFATAVSSAGLIALVAAGVIHFTPRAWIHVRLRDTWTAVPAPLQATLLVAATGVLAALSYAKAPFIYFQF